MTSIRKKPHRQTARKVSDTCTCSVTIGIPNHVSSHDRVVPAWWFPESQQLYQEQQLLPIERQQQEDGVVVLLLTCYRPSVFWRCLKPLVLESSRRTVRRFWNRLLAAQSLSFQDQYLRENHDAASFTSSSAMVQDPDSISQANENEEAFSFVCRTFKIQLPRSFKRHNNSDTKYGTCTRSSRTMHIFVWMTLPPQPHSLWVRSYTGNIDNNNSNNNNSNSTSKKSSCRRLLHCTDLDPSMTLSAYNLRSNSEQRIVQQQTLLAWYATLGGGYFFCHQLSKSYELAKQQTQLAMQLGNIPMVHQCIIHQAYNLFHAGQFKNGFQLLYDLHQATMSTEKSSATTTMEDENDLLVSSSSSSSSSACPRIPITTIPEENAETQRKCRVAWMWGQRMYDMSQTIEPYYETNKTESSKANNKDNIFYISTMGQTTNYNDSAVATATDMTNSSSNITPTTFSSKEHDHDKVWNPFSMYNKEDPNGKSYHRSHYPNEERKNVDDYQRIRIVVTNNRLCD